LRRAAFVNILNLLPVPIIMRYIFTIAILLLSITTAYCQAKNLESLESTVVDLVRSDKILGVQLLIGKGGQILLERHFGVLSANDVSSVNAETQFCIGSCSKPLASATILTLVHDKRLNLDTPINTLLPEFDNIEVAGRGTADRNPSLRELLSHRGGLYSQKLGMNKRQTRYIRDFKLTLEDAVKGIANESLISIPGTDYAYSGAGYCILGRVAEVGTNQSFEALFQAKIAQPLKLYRTTYFPNPSDPNIATGSANGKLNPQTPHLSKPFNLPLIGGSLYSTARDSARFARMVINKGSLEKNEILSKPSWDDYTQLHFEGKVYGLGWTLKMNNRRTIEVSHTGALASSRASFRINLESGVFAIALYTLTDPSVSADTGRRLNAAISAVTSSQD
jgi:CubicO group peptidase (beta-lactamase class C family)